MTDEVAAQTDELRKISHNLDEPAARVRHLAGVLIMDAGPELLAAALGNSAGQVNLGLASELPAAMASLGTVLAEGYAPALISIANAFDAQENVSSRMFAHAPEDVA
jgi:hypothetical protein